MKQRAIVGAALTATAAVVGYSCVPAYNFSASDADAGTDSATDTTTHSDPGSDAPLPDAMVDGNPSPPVDAAPPPPPTPTGILSAVGIQTETGNAQQQHLIYAENSKTWWLFYIDADDLSVKTESSPDFVTWSPGATLTPLPLHLGGDGRNFSVAYANLNGVDVIHLATSLHDEPKRVVYDTRATITGATINFGTPVLVHDIDDVGYDAGPQGDTSCDPDGTGVTIAGDGHVYVATAWVSIPGSSGCDSNFATSTSLETGTSWTPGFGSPLTHFTVGGETHVRQVIGMSSGVALGAWDSADMGGDIQSDVYWASNSGGMWPDDGKYPIFTTAPAGGEYRNDWSMCRIDDSHVHILRRRMEMTDAGDASMSVSAAFDHYFYNGTSWTYLGALGDDLGFAGSGVTLVTNGTNLLAATISGDGNTNIRYATYNGAWSSWSTLNSTDGVRASISGSGCGDPAHPALLWLAGPVAPYTVEAVQVSALIP